MHSYTGFGLVVMGVDVRSFVAQVFFFFSANPSCAVGVLTCGLFRLNTCTIMYTAFKCITCI